ncbi:MFS transporter [Flaviflexus massiliensis]|uniref:MFS transporter n=1 Tax=Flaviflexus massiliensis TaxID=1522309 RepID=UPI0006D56C96|nr:MFS transporter [Flaviflexus massiliensis]
MARHPRKQRTASETAQRWLLWIATAIITCIAFEALAVTTAMPTVTKDLNGEHMFALANGITLAAQLITTALCGPWADAKGVRAPLFTGLIVFSAGLVMCTFAPEIEILVLGRLIQGLGGGLCIVPLYVLVGRLVPGKRQPTFFAAFSAAWVVPSLIGPALSGFLAQHVHWRVVFIIVPVLLLVLLPLLAKVLSMLPAMEFTGKLSKLKTVALPALGAGIAAIALQVMSGTDSEDFTPLVFAGIVVAAVAALAFVRPMLPSGTLLLKRGMPSTVALRGMLNGTFLAVEIYLPLMLQRIHGWEPLDAGLTLTVGSITWSIGSFVQARIIDPGQRKRLASFGSAILLIGTAATIPVAWVSVAPWFLIVAWAVAGLGIGIAYPAMATHALALTPIESQGQTSSALQVSDTLGASLCIAFAGIVFALISGFGTASFAAVLIAMSLLALASLAVSFRVEPNVTETDLTHQASTR